MIECYQVLEPLRTPDEANALNGVDMRIEPMQLIVDEQGEINTRNTRLLTRNVCLPKKPWADHPLQPLLARKGSTQTLADTSRVFPDTRLRTALGREDVYT
jgi:hypothetical protein